jgi:hypothetical protein
MNYTLDDFHISKFAKKTTEEMLEMYRWMFAREHEMVNEIFFLVNPEEKRYFGNLVHEGRGKANSVISGLSNLEYFTLKRDANEAKAFRQSVEQNLLEFTIYMQSLLFFYNTFVAKR